MVAERLGLYITEKGLSYYLFENSIGASRGSISKAVKDNKSIGSSVLEKILIIYKDLNPIWLLTGKGNMLLSSDKNLEKVSNTNKIDLENFDKLQLIEYISDNLDEFKEYRPFQQLTKLLFADEEMASVKKEIQQLKEELSKIAK